MSGPREEVTDDSLTFLQRNGVPDASIILASRIMDSTNDVPAPICLWADVVAVHSVASMVTEILDQGLEAEVDGVDFAGVVAILRDAAAKFEAIGKRLAS